MSAPPPSVRPDTGRVVGLAEPEAPAGTARKGALAVLDQAVASGTSFATSVILGRACSRDDLGVYALALTVVMLLRGIQGELVCSPYTIYSQRRARGGLAAYTGSTLAHYLALTALSTAGALSLAGVLSLGVGPAGLAGPLWVLAGALPFLLLREYLRQVSLASLRLGVVLALDSSVAALQLGSLLLLARVGLLGVGAACAALGAACACACLGWFLAGPLPVTFLRGRVAADWWHNWPFARWSLACFLVGSTTPLVVPWVVALSHGESATGLLSACNTLINAAGMYVTGVANLLTPRAARAFARGGPGELRRVLERAGLLFAFTLGAFCALVVAAGDLPVTLLYGAGFSGCALPLALLALTLLVNSLGTTAGNGLWALERPRANFAADVCTLATTALAVACLVPPLGVPGAAGALLAGGCAGAAVRAITLVRLIHRNPPEGIAVGEADLPAPADGELEPNHAGR